MGTGNAGGSAPGTDRTSATCEREYEYEYVSDVTGQCENTRNFFFLKKHMGV